ncbi:RNA-directed DNA polymerase, eukaryota [Tanacetum coccineum]
MSKNHRNNINYNRRPLNSDEDFTRKISHSIFVTNFPDSVTSRDLWKECSVYGTVVDVFIPAKKSMAGSPKDFGRMDKFSEPDRRLGKSGPHLFVANGHSVFPGSSISPSPALVLGDECIVERDFSKCAMGRLARSVREDGLLDSYDMVLWVEGESSQLCVIESVKHFSRIWAIRKGGEILDIEAQFSIRHVVLIAFVHYKAYSSDDESVCGEKDKEVHSHLNEEEEGEFVSSDVDEVADTNFDNGTDLPKQHNEGRRLLFSWKTTYSSGWYLGEDNRAWRVCVWESRGCDSIGASGGVLCIWEESVFKKDHVMISTQFCGFFGSLVEQPLYRRLLWDYMSILLSRWNGEAILMGDFNEVRSSDERRGSWFNSSNARIFNNFISSSSLVDVKMEGYSFTWSHPSASKMSKLDRFLVTDGIISLFPSVTALCLDRHLSDHRPILLCEVKLDFGPIPFRFYHSWFTYDGFDAMVEQTWRSFSHTDNNRMIRFKKKLQDLKQFIRIWIKDKKIKSSSSRLLIEKELCNIDKSLEKDGATDALLLRRHDLICQLKDIKYMIASDSIQKSKVTWAIEGDENSKFFHGIINKKRSHLAVRPLSLSATSSSMTKLNFEFPNRLSSVLAADLEREVSQDEIKSAVWECGVKKHKKALFFKVDFAKAYDSVRWDFLIDVLEAFGFGLKWLELLMKGEWSDANLRVGVPRNSVEAMAASIGCSFLESKFCYLGVMVTVIEIGSCASPLYTMLSLKFLKGLLKAMESIMNVINTKFWFDRWKGDKPFRVAFPRLFALETNNQFSIAEKMSSDLVASFRRAVRGGIEQQQLSDLSSLLASVSISPIPDRWVCSLAKKRRSFKR